MITVKPRSHFQNTASLSFVKLIPVRLSCHFLPPSGRAAVVFARIGAESPYRKQRPPAVISLTWTGSPESNCRSLRRSLEDQAEPELADRGTASLPPAPLRRQIRRVAGHYQTGGTTAGLKPTDVLDTTNGPLLSGVDIAVQTGFAAVKPRRRRRRDHCGSAAGVFADSPEGARR